MTTKHVGDLAHQEPQVAGFDLDVLEAKDRFARDVVAAEDLVVELEPG